MAEERNSMVDHPNSFKSRGIQDFDEEVMEYLFDGIDRNTSEMDVLKTIVSTFTGQEVGIVTTPLSSGSYNRSIVTIIDWNKEKNEDKAIYESFRETGFESDYVPFAYREGEDSESLFLAEKADTPSPWVRVFNDESTGSWVGHYFANSLRNCGIVLPDKLSEFLGGMTMKQTEEFYNKQMQSLKEDMDNNIAAVSSQGLLDPINGVSMEDWAAANARIVSGESLDSILGVLGISKDQWDSISDEWNARMARDTTHAISTVYGQAFSNSNIGRFQQEGGGSSAGGDAAAGGGMAAVLEDFDLYVKIMAHQNAGSMKGEDAAEILGQYGLTPGDWGSVSAQWSGKMASNMQLAMKMSELLDKYTAEFS